ncbi:MAG TPA: peptidoglycan bridge formation glycyltransferase FemA/FemB family protein [Candidatus Methanoperedens sp.]
MIEFRSDPDKKQWAEFVYNHPHGNIFQTPEMAEVNRHTKNYEPITLAALKSEEIVALVNAVVIKEMRGSLGQLTARAIIQGGPLFIDDETGREAVKSLMEHYDAIACKKAIYTQIRNMWDTSYYAFPEGYRYEGHLNFLVDLGKSRDELWSSLSKSRRYGIKKGLKEGVLIEEIKSLDEITVAYNLLLATYKKARIPLADISLFISMFEILSKKDMGRIFFAKSGDICIGVILILIYKDSIYDWYAGASRDYLNLYPNDILPWHAMEWGLKNGFSVFDFGGAGKPDEKYGVRDFKSQFGGTMQNFGRYEKIYSPNKLWISKKGLGIYKKISRLNYVGFSH